ncbi:MAG: hypothetical protein QM811_20880 [Pirellulales bacterium]
MYAAAWPTPGLLGLLGAVQAPLYADDGFAQIPGGGLVGQDLWQRNRGTLSVVSWDRNTLADVAARFPVGQAERPAQLRLHIADVQAGQMRDFANALGFFRARQVSAGNIHFLSLLTNQLGVKAEDARKVAEDLIQGKLVDPLGGDYELGQVDGEAQWRGTAWTPETGRLTNRVPADFLTPTMKWFRGVDADVAILPDEYAAHIEVEMRREPRADVAPASQLPAFSFPKFQQQEPAPSTTPDKSNAATSGRPPLPPPPTEAERGVRKVPPPPTADPPRPTNDLPETEETRPPAKRVPPPLPRPEEFGRPHASSRRLHAVLGFTIFVPHRG